MVSDETTLFDSVVVEAVANEDGIERDRLFDALGNHQRSVEELPGVENIVYEWRKQYEDPLLSRTESAYYLGLPAGIWSEFGDALELEGPLLGAVVDVHRRTVSERCDVPASPAEGVEYVALDRTQ